MPVNVRIRILFWILIGLFVLSFLASKNSALALIFLIAVLLYVEMIYPKWNFFGRAIQNVRSRGKKSVALTFDDGPSEWTPAILDALKAQNIKATFFLLGKNVERHPQIARRIQEEGHTIGYHGYSHTKFHFKGPTFIKEDLDQCARAFQKAGIQAAPLIRFPHGFKNVFAVLEAKRRGWTLASWGKGVWDSKKPGVQTIVERSLSLNAGEILLLHDGDGIKQNPDRSQTAEAIPLIVKNLSEQKSFDFVTLNPNQ